MTLPRSCIDCEYCSGLGMENQICINDKSPFFNKVVSDEVFCNRFQERTIIQVIDDPQENDPIKGPIIRSAIQMAGDLHNNWVGLGQCHMVWDSAKKYLLDHHNIDWKTPAEMNPGITFD